MDIEEKKLKPGSLKSYTIFLLFTALLIGFMIVGEPILIPLCWAFLFSSLMLPVSRFLERRGLSRTSSSIVSTVIFCISGGFIMYFLVYEATQILINQNELYSTVISNSKYLLDELQRLSNGLLNFDQMSAESMSPSSALSAVAKPVKALGDDLVILTLIPMYLFFCLNYRNLIIRFIQVRFTGHAFTSSMGFLKESETSINNYLTGTFILTLISALMSFVILLIFGIKHAFFFGVFIAVLNLIPFIGNLIAFVVVLFFTWATKDSITITLVVAGLLYLSNLVQENFLRPKILGNKMEMNAMVVFTAVIVGGLIWGFSGMVLFIPLLGVLQAVIHARENWKPYGEFFKSN